MVQKDGGAGAVQNQLISFLFSVCFVSEISSLRAMYEWGKNKLSFILHWLDVRKMGQSRSGIFHISGLH
jgi:hypothetical protein